MHGDNFLTDEEKDDLRGCAPTYDRLLAEIDSLKAQNDIIRDLQDPDAWENALTQQLRLMEKIASLRASLTVYQDAFSETLDFLESAINVYRSHTHTGSDDDRYIEPGEVAEHYNKGILAGYENTQAVLQGRFDHAKMIHCEKNDIEPDHSEKS